MSQMLPRETVDALRKQVNVSLDLYGISCDLYIPNNLSETEVYDIYQTPGDYTFDHYTSKVFVNWNPNIYRLKAKGLYIDGDDVDILRHSYISIEPEYVPDNYEGIEEFELIDIVVDKFHDKVVVKSFKAVPRRYEDVSG